MLGRLAMGGWTALAGARRVQPSAALQTSAVLRAEPLKKKRRLDPAVLKMRVERKVKKIEKSIRQLEMADKVLKPLLEQTVPPHVHRELALRTRPAGELAPAQARLDRLLPAWTAYRKEVDRQQQRSVRQVLRAQQRALLELRAESEPLYRRAIAVDAALLPFDDELVLTESGPSASYRPPDGLRTDVTKQWIM